MSRTSTNRIAIAGVAIGLVVAGLGWVAYERSARPRVEVVLPCGYDRPFLVAFGAPLQESPTVASTLRVEVPETGIAYVPEHLLSRKPFAVEGLFLCEGMVRRPTPDERLWEDEVGTVGQGPEKWLYYCAYPAEQYSRIECDVLAEEASAYQARLGKVP